MAPRTVLVIDDDELLGELIQKELAADGYEVHCATDGFTGLAIAEEKKPDVALIDIMMPDIDGHAVLQKLRANPDLADMTVIMLTARRDRDDIIGAARSGADGYLAKPFDMGELKMRIAEMDRWLV